MRDEEARAFVAQAVAEGLKQHMPTTPVEKVQQVAADLTNTIVNNYLYLRLMGAGEPEGKAS